MNTVLWQKNVKDAVNRQFLGELIDESWYYWLGRMGEGMSRRMLKNDIEVYGYRNNHQKANEQYEKGYISGYATSLESCFAS